MRIGHLCIAAGLCLIAVDAQSADIAAGEVQAQPCKGCHGMQGISVIPTIPSLAGQKDGFLQWQLVFFRSGRRENPIMGPLSANLSDEDIRNLGAYFASLPSPEPAPTQTNPTLRHAGETIAEQHHCAACHTEGFGGNRAAPAIARQQRDYLVKALTDYRSNARPSVGVAAMTEAASGLSDGDIEALALFLAVYP